MCVWKNIRALTSEYIKLLVRIDAMKRFTRGLNFPTVISIFLYLCCSHIISLIISLLNFISAFTCLYSQMVLFGFLLQAVLSANFPLFLPVVCCIILCYTIAFQQTILFLGYVWFIATYTENLNEVIEHFSAVGRLVNLKNQLCALLSDFIAMRGLTVRHVPVGVFPKSQ